MKLQATFEVEPKGRDLPFWLALNRYPGFGPQKFKKLCALSASLSDWFINDRPTAEFKQWLASNRVPLVEIDWRGVEKDLAWALKADCHILTLAHSDYPKRLRHIPSPPPVLFVKGDVALLEQPQIGMVGSRHPTQEGLENAFQFAKQLSHWGLIVTSGLAQGIDGACHKGALQGKSPTIAILGNGLNEVYPKKHHLLAMDILANGVLVSEIPIDSPPRREHFPRRNRIISGLSYGIIVVEAAKKSGSLITANYAIEQGREVFALPGSIHNPLAKGCHQLIREGAICIEDVSQVLEALAPVLTEFQGDASINFNDIVSQRSNQLFGREEIHSHIQDPMEATLMAALSDICTPIDVIVQQTGLSAQQVSVLLLSLELSGQVKSVPGGIVRLNNR